MVLPFLDFRNLIKAALSPHERDTKVGCIVLSDRLIVGNYAPLVVADVPQIVLACGVYHGRLLPRSEDVDAMDYHGAIEDEGGIKFSGNDNGTTFCPIGIEKEPTLINCRVDPMMKIGNSLRLAHSDVLEEP